MNSIRAEAVLALLLAVAAVHNNWRANRGSDAVDFYQFWLVGQAAGEVRDPYAPEARRALGEAGFRSAQESGSPGQRAAADRRRVLDTTATPFLYTAFRVLATGDYELDYALFRLLSLACTCAAVLLLCALFGWALPAALLALAVLLLAAPPYASDATVGNVNQLQLAGLAALLALSGAEERKWMAPASGGVAALLVLFKPNLAVAEALLVATFLARGRLRFAALHLAGAAAGALCAVAASSLAFGSVGVWRSWALALAALDGGPTLPLSLGNVSLGGLLAPPARALLVAALVVATLAALWFGRRRGRDLDAATAAAGAGVCIPLIGAALSWEHYFVLATPFVIAFLRPGARPLAFAAGSASAGLLWLLPGLTSSERPGLLAVELAAGAAVLLVACWHALAAREPGTRPALTS